MSRSIVDARGLLCPLPVIRVQERVAALKPGDLVEAICSDPGALNDIPAWCKINGHQIVETIDERDEIRITVRVCNTR
ncbi:MAG: sulfurtransferase TusA family protein [Gammaproteobacteria bacterium]|jgi:tRNA 2-thiouridine synthesizing protein A|nr:sulfurtransferase TusA family protein [Gammaproteobacteria bacterium]